MADDWVRDEESARRIEERTKHSTVAKYSNRPAARLLEYGEYNEHERITCLLCDWSGQAREGQIEFHEALFDVSCPRCEKMLLVVSFVRH